MFLRLKESEKVLKALCHQNFNYLLRLFKSQSGSNLEDIKMGAEFYKT